MTSAFQSFDASPLGARLQSAVDLSGAFGGVGGVIVNGAGRQVAVKSYTYGLGTGLPPTDWAIDGKIFVYGATVDRPTDLRGLLISNVGSYSWRGLPSTGPNSWGETVNYNTRVVTRFIPSIASDPDEWTFSASDITPDNPLAGPGDGSDPSFTTSIPRRVIETAVRSVSSTPSDDDFTVYINGGTTVTTGVVDVATTAAQIVSDLNGSANPNIAKYTWSNTGVGVLIDDGDGVFDGTEDTAASGASGGTFTVSGTGTGTVEPSRFGNRFAVFYDVTRNVLWSI